MEFDIHAGKRVLYKKNGNNWYIGELASGAAIINASGLILPVYPQEVFSIVHSDKYTFEGPEYLYVDINDIFLDARPLESWITKYKEYFMNKEQYIQYIESEDFEKNFEHAYVTDGEYVYYPISKYNKTWIEKQPFEFIVRYDN